MADPFLLPMVGTLRPTGHSALALPGYVTSGSKGGNLRARRKRGTKEIIAPWQGYEVRLLGAYLQGAS